MLSDKPLPSNSRHPQRPEWKLGAICKIVKQNGLAKQFEISPAISDEGLADISCNSASDLETWDWLLTQPPRRRQCT